MKDPQFIISALGLIAGAAIFLHWQLTVENTGLAGRLAALLSIELFAAACLRFVPRWLDFWAVGMQGACDALPSGEGGEAPYITAKLFLGLLAIDIIVLALVIPVRLAAGLDADIGFWRCADSQHYLNIAEDWYLSEGSHDRLVELVFLPGYPLLVRLVGLLAGDTLLSALLSSGLCFALSGCLLYRLARLDFDARAGLRAVKFLCLTPGAFFFAAPMSESLFLLLCLGCIYLSRTGRTVRGCLLGALAAFTRSPGLALVVPLAFEAVAQLRREEKPGLSRIAASFLPLLLIPMGFAAYCGINYAVSGDPLKFMEYQREHWGQSFGWFFSTASYQTELALSALKSDPTTAWGLWIPNVAASLGSLAIMFVAAKRLRPSYTAWYLAYYFVAIGATWLLSAPRYLAGLAVTPLSLSAVTQKRGAERGLTALCTALYIAYYIMFALRWQVW